MASEQVDLGALLEEIQAAADSHRSSGLYPEDLDARLQSEYARHFDLPDLRDRFDGVRLQLKRAHDLSGFSVERVSLESGLPGGEFVHKAVGKVVSRQVLGLIEQLNSFTTELMPLLSGLTSLVEEPAAHHHNDLAHELDTVQERLGVVERAAGRLRATVDDLGDVLPRLLHHLNRFDGVEARLDEVDERERRRAFNPTFSSSAFGDATRGSATQVRDEYAPLADSLVGLPGPVLDIGAGRGELLALLRERQVDAFGVELDEELAHQARAEGLDVRHGDGLDVLRAQSPSSLGAVVLIHVVEHLHPNELLDVIHLAFDRLYVGGKLVIETPNPQSLYVYARAFWLDPTHLRPVHPIYLEFLLKNAGYRHYDFEWTAMPSDDERLLEIPGDGEAVDAMNANVRRLNSLIFGAQNYRVIAMR